MRPEHGPVLAHDVHMGIGAEFGDNPADENIGACRIFRHNKVADYHPALRDAVYRLEQPDLPVHLFDCRRRVGRIVWRLREAGSMLRVLELEVRQIDIDNAIKQPNHLKRVVAAGVVQQRYGQPPANGLPERCYNVGNQMRGRNQIDVMASPALEIQHYAGKRRMAGLRPIPPVGNLPVLAKDAEQVAVGEKDRPRPPPAAQRTFFAGVGAGRSDPEVSGGGADAHAACRAVGAAHARTKAARSEHIPQRPLAAFKLAGTL